MKMAEHATRAPARNLPEAIARTVRHEMGDLLQTIYATVAILQKRLPADLELERRVLADLRKRAESCKQLIDAVHDFIQPLELAPELTDLADLAETLVATARERFPSLLIETRPQPVEPALVDGRRMALVGEALLANACEAARQRVGFITGPGRNAGEIEWAVMDDGPGFPTESLDCLFLPFFTTRHGHAGLGLASAQRIVRLHGGKITAENLPGGGLCVRIVLPANGPTRLQPGAARLGEPDA
jgi:signal transduction histidine kinase